MKSLRNSLFLALILASCLNLGCFRYSFTGVSIPADVETIFIPFFTNQAQTAVPGLPDLVNEALVDRFVNQSRLRLSNERNQADAVLDGQIIRYSNKPFSISSQEQANLNRVEIAVRVSYKYAKSDQPEWNKEFSGFGEFDPATDPINGENEAAAEAIQQLAETIFNEALGSW